MKILPYILDSYLFSILTRKEYFQMLMNTLYH